MKTDVFHLRGRGWAYAGAILGGGISIAANVAHSFVAPDGAPQDWTPQPGAVIGSMFWPILLFVGVEILARVRWRPGFWWGFLRFGGMIPVSAVAGLVSYRHMQALLLYYGEDLLVATLGPLAIDGLMVMATAALLVISLNAAPGVEDEPEQPKPNRFADLAQVDWAGLRLSAAPQVRVAARTVLEEFRQAGKRLTVDQLAVRLNIGTAIAGRLLADLQAEDVESSTAGQRVAVVEPDIALTRAARFAMNSHFSTHGEPIEAGQLAAVMNVQPDVAAELLAAAATPSVNGYAHALGGAR